MKHKRITKLRTEQVLIVSHPPYNGVARTLKDLTRCANAIHHVRCVVLDKKLDARLVAYADAVNVIRDTLPRITDGKPIDGPCDLNVIISKAAGRNRKFRDALNLIGFGR